jgi:acetylornithine aminotransferase/acetylornithine/N-succinyldiaminopimelate aminotransferase
MGALSTTAAEKYRAPFEPLVPGVRFVRFNDVRDLERKFDKSVCAVAVEPLQGEGGIRPLSPEFMTAARALSKDSGALLLCDEIQCGLGRTGQPFAFQGYRVKPDIVTIAKPLAGGLPMGAILTTEAVSRAMHPGLHGTTFGGGPMACAAALAFLDVLEKPETLAHVKLMGAYFKRKLVELAARHEGVREVRGVGLMLGMELDSAERAKAVFQGLLDRCIIANRTQEVVLRFLPPYIITARHVDVVIRALDEVLGAGGPPAPPVPLPRAPGPRRKS